MYKSNTELIVIDAKATEPISTNVVFWSHDKGTAKLVFELKKDTIPQSLAEGTKVPILLEFSSATAEGGKGKHTYFATIDDAINGIVSIVLEDNILGYDGRVDGSIYIELPDSRSLDTAGRFNFTIRRSPIDEDVPELEDYYWQGFNEIMEQYHKSISEIKLEAKQLLDDLTLDVNTAKTKVTALEKSITTATSNLNARVDEINKKIDENDVFTKAESSANVINQIGGAESAVLKKEMLVNGVEGTASRYVKDISASENLLGVFKNSRWKLDSKTGRVVIEGASSGSVLSEVTLPAGTYTVSFKVFQKPTTSTSFSFYVDGAVENSGAISNFNGFNTGVLFTKKIILTKESVVKYTLWGNAQFDTISFEMKMEKGDYTKYSPASEWFGIVHGQQNWVSGVPSSVETTSSLNLIGQIKLSESGLIVGDEICAKAKGHNNSITSFQFLLRPYKSDGNAIANWWSSELIPANSDFEGFSLGGVKIPELTDTIRFYVQKTEGVGGSVDNLKIKLIKGSKAAMDEWTPSQTDSGLTIINNGMVPFTDDEYADLLSEDGIVRAETLIVGRGAEIEFPFDVIGTLEQKYPYLFKGLTTAADKIAKYKQIYKNAKLVATYRGGGINDTTGKPDTACGICIMNRVSGAYWGYMKSGGINFNTQEREFLPTHLGTLTVDGKYIFTAVSRKNGSADTNYTISDGVTPAWIEVKDIRLTVELEVNGRTIIEEMIAANHVENLATQTEAVTATDNTKTMTPLRTKQFLDSKLLNMVYPIGSVYLSVNSASPNTLFGGIWERYAKGRVLVGVDEEDVVLSTAGKQGGSANGVAEHTHITKLTTFRVTTAGSGTVNNLARSTDQGNAMTGEFGSVTSTGDNTYHNNWQPFETVYIWKRIA